MLSSACAAAWNGSSLEQVQPRGTSRHWSVCSRVERVVTGAYAAAWNESSLEQVQPRGTSGHWSMCSRVERVDTGACAAAWNECSLERVQPRGTGRHWSRCSRVERVVTGACAAAWNGSSLEQSENHAALSTLPRRVLARPSVVDGLPPHAGLVPLPVHVSLQPRLQVAVTRVRRHLATCT